MNRFFACCMVTVALAFTPEPAFAALICYFGADLDQDKAKDTAKGIGEKLDDDTSKTSFGTDIAGNEIFDKMKTAAGSCYNATTGKFDCSDGVLLVYISAHGGYTADGKDTVIANPKKDGTVKLSELTTAIAGTIPDCCTLIFALDACAADAWYNEYVAAEGDAVNPKNPFGNLNWLVIIPTIKEGRCFGTPVGDALKKAFGTSQTVSELSASLGAGVTAKYSLDDKHDYRLDAFNVPEPEMLTMTLLSLPYLSIRRRRAALRRR